MASIVLVVAVVLLFLFKAYNFVFGRPLENAPPGPPRIPILGSYIFLYLINRNYLHLAVEKLCKFYKTKVLELFVGDTYCVIAHDQDSVREVFFNPDFDGRMDFFMARMRTEKYLKSGIFFTDGMYWQDQRRFTLRNLRDFGFGRRFEEYEIEVKNEMENLVKIIKEGPKYSYEKNFIRPNGELLLPKALIGCVGNCFLQVLANERFSREDTQEIFKAGFASFDFQFYSDEYGKYLSVFPWMRFVSPDLSRYKVLRESSMIMYNFMKKIIDRQIATYDKTHIRSFMDLYIKEMNASDGTDRGYLYEQMVMICTDFLFPSLSAVETQITFLLRMLLHRRDILMKIQAEIDEVVGEGRLPSLDDRVNMPYSEACLREGMRYDTLVPSSVPHRTIVETKLGGYEIPKNTMVLASLHALHSSKEVWKDPENFRPERFLNYNGQLTLKYDKTLPFGGGRRLCAGETFARNTMFLCVTALLQNFNIQSAEEKSPSLNDNVSGLIKMPRDFWMKFETR